MSSNTPWQSPSGPDDAGSAPSEPRFGSYGTPAAGQPSSSSPSQGPAPTWAPGAGSQAPGAAGFPTYSGQVPQGAPSFFVAPKPGIIPLRPLSITEIIGGAFEALRANPKAMFVPAIVVMAIVGLLSAVQTFFTTSSLYSSLASLEASPGNGYPSDEVALGLVAESLSAGSASLVSSLLTYLASAILTGLLIVAVSRSVLGRVASPGEVWQRTKSRVWALIGQTFLIGLIVSAATLIVGLVVLFLIAAVLAPVLNDSSYSVALSVIVIVALVALGAAGVILTAFLSVRLALSPAALILENVGVIDGMKRSWALTRGYFWHVLGTLLLAGIITTIAIGILSGISGFVTGLLTVFSIGAALALIGAISTFIGSLASALVLPFSAAVTALIYIDLRMRQEGLDVELRQSAGV